jgi:hypothetical protein
VPNVALRHGLARCAEVLNDSCCFIQRSGYQYSASSAIMDLDHIQALFNLKRKYQNGLEHN